MNIVLCGQQWLGEQAFALILRLGHRIVAVSAPPDDRLHHAAEDAGVRILDALTADAVPAETDLIVAAHAHAFIGASVRAVPRIGVIGYHPSLLPLHRGRDAVRWAIHMRERVTGGTVYWFTDTVDGGPIAAQEHVFIRPDDTPQTLWRRELAPLGLTLLERVLNDIEMRHIVKVPQDHSLATWEPAFDVPRMARRAG
ncbi:MAG: methionyl-tRNA formyltransferase [Thermomicrobia bacterium]|nr:methionyl-tRNA formyltransferase [Thermomicrobia bacterium]